MCWGAVAVGHALSRCLGVFPESSSLRAFLIKSAHLHSISDPSKTMKLMKRNYYYVAYLVAGAQGVRVLSLIARHVARVGRENIIFLLHDHAS